MSIDRAIGVGGVSIGLIGTGIVVLLPDKRWLGWVFIAVGSGIAALAVLYAIAKWQASKEYERAHPRVGTGTPQPSQQLTQSAPINNSPVFAPVFAPSFNQEQPQTKKQPKDDPKTQATPNLVNDNERIIEVTQNEYRELALGGEELAAVVAFRNDPTALFPVSEALVRANIYYEQLDGPHKHRVVDGTWLKSTEVHIAFRPGDVNELILAWKQGDQVMTYENKQVPHPTIR
jgi:hypothetical protein